MRVLITGGTGFLGQQLALALKSNHRVSLCGRKGSAKSEETTGCRALSADVTDVGSLKRAFDEVNPEMVIHAAANKFVAAADQDPFGCIDVNLLGSQNVARLAMEHEVDTVVAVSTSAAAPPQASLYGLAKAVTERMFCSLNGKGKTRFTSVRLGSVAWSTGSVLPTWQGMLERDGVIETTGSEQRRFMCSVDEAVESITGLIGDIDRVAGKVVVRKSKQAKIKDVLDQFVALRGGSWKPADVATSEPQVETLIGDLELPYVEEISLGGVVHFAISFNQKAAQPIRSGLSVINAEALSVDEIRALIQASHPGGRRASH